MIIIINNFDPATIQMPWLGILVEVHISLGSSHNNFCFASIEEDSITKILYVSDLEDLDAENIKMFLENNNFD